MQVLFSVEQTAAILGVGRTKVYELIGTGALGTVKIGSRTLISRAHIDTFVQKLTHGAELHER